jgi:hypothetical protein
MWDNDVQLVVKIFQQILPLRQMDNSVDYLERHKGEIEAAGRQLKFLQLVKFDKKSPLGWRPTELLLKYLAERVTVRRSRRPLYEASSMYLLVRYTALNFGKNIFSRELLIALGLIRSRGGEDWVTSDLHRLLCDGCCAERIARRRKLYWRRRRREQREGGIVAQQAIGAERLGDGKYVIFVDKDDVATVVPYAHAQAAALRPVAE